MDLLSSHQFSTITSMMDSPDKVVMLNGEAGTGKSYTIANFIKSQSADTSIIMCSTTHAALANLGDLLPDEYDCDVTRATVHSFTNHILSYDNNGNEVLTKTYKPNKLHNTQYDYMIVDEVSMLPNIVLKDLYTGDGNRLVQKKIILVGDPIQLSVDEFLNLDAIPNFELTENHRQDRNSDLYQYCTKLRTQIKNLSGPIPLPAGSLDFNVSYNHEEFIQNYKSSISDSKAILAFHNSTVTNYNNAIKKYFMNADVYSLHDELILIDSHALSVKGKLTQIYHNREKLTIIAEPYIKKYLGIECRMLPVENRRGVKSIIKVPLVKARLKELLDKYKSSKDWESFYRTKEQFNYVHHSYAQTVFMAQGSTYDEVYIDMIDFTPPKDPLKNKLLKMVYVALTRARKKVYVYLGPDSERNFKSFEI